MDTQRHTGLDLLRLVSMLMIITLHALAHGGALYAASAPTPALFCWTLEALAYVGVNGYVLLSGYFLIRAEFRLHRLLRLWAEVLFYSIVLYLVAVLFGAEAFSPLRAVKFLLPTLTRKYWFFTAYVALMLLSPFLNRLLLSLPKRSFQILLAVLIGLFCVWPNLLAFSDLLPFGDGRSVCWFVTLYCIAAYLRLYPVTPRRGVCLAVYFGCALGCAAERFLYLHFLQGGAMVAAFGDTAKNLPTLFYANNSVPVLASSVALFLFFQSIAVSGVRMRRAVTHLASLTFGVYLLHDHESIRQWLWPALHLSDSAASLRIVWLLPAVCLAVFVCALAVEQLRQLLFRPLMRAPFWQKPDERLRRYLTERPSETQE